MTDDGPEQPERPWNIVSLEISDGLLVCFYHFDNGVSFYENMRRMYVYYFVCSRGCTDETTPSYEAWSAMAFPTADKTAEWPLQSSAYASIASNPEAMCGDVPSQSDSDLVLPCPNTIVRSIEHYPLARLHSRARTSPKPSPIADPDYIPSPIDAVKKQDMRKARRMTS